MQNNVSLDLMEFVEKQILPRYTAFGESHGLRHVSRVIKNSMELARITGANIDMVYVIAAYHDLGLSVDREFHHIHSGEILMADTNLRQWFTEEQLLTMRDAVEDHRASAKRPPRTIYGAIVAEADRQIDPETILRRTLQYGMKQNPAADFDWHFDRAYAHMLDKYAEGGYLRLWLNSERNVQGLTRLRAIINNKDQMRKICRNIYENL